MRPLAAIILACYAAFGLELDVDYLRSELSKHPDDTKTMLLLAKYHLEQNQTRQAKEYLQKILRLEPQNSQAKELLRRLELLEQKRALASRYGSIAAAVDTLYAKKEYDKLLGYAPLLLGEELGDEERFKLARAAMAKKRYELARKFLDGVADKEDLRYHELAGLACHHLGDEECAKAHFERLLQSDDAAAYIEPLLEIYAKEGRTQRYRELLLLLKQKDPTNPRIAKYESTLKELERRLDKEEYERFLAEPTYQRLQNLVFRYYRHDPYTILDLFRYYFEHHPHDQKALTLFGRIATWRGDINLPDDLLAKVARSKNYEAKLLVGKALSWQGEYERALPYLLEVLQNGDAKQRYEAKKAIAFIYKWQNEDQKAKKLFEELYAQNPKDREVKEALDILNGDVRRWIDYYEEALKSEPNNSDYLLRLAQYYRLAGDIERSIAMYERYLKLRPDDLQIHRYLGDLYLSKKRYFKGFSHLEYYAEASGDPKAFIELARRYYWHGYHKEALDVLEELLKYHPDNTEARKLKAKILQASPRYLHTQGAAAAKKERTEQSVASYFRTKASQSLAVADELYFSGHYKGSLPYFRDYLRLEPKDNAARERYAFALEHAGSFAEAAAEFFLLLRQKDDPIWRYHYAYNLAKSGKKEQAKRELDRLLKSLPKPLPKKIASFLRQWEDAWEHLDFERYASLYDPKAFGEKWRRKKRRLFERNGFVEVVIKDPVLLEQRGDTYVVRFYQIYRSKLRGDRGYKTLVIRCEGQECKIVKESWRPGLYKKAPDYGELRRLAKELLQSLQEPAKSEPSQSIPKPAAKPAANPNPPATPEAPKASASVMAAQPAAKVSAPEKKTLIFEPSALYFKDNQELEMAEYGLKMGAEVAQGTIVWGSLRRYRLEDGDERHSGGMYGAGIEKGGLLAGYILDRSGDKERHGFIFKKEWDGYTLTLSRQNAVYTKRTACSRELMRNLASLSANMTLLERELWMRADLAKIDRDYEKTLLYDWVLAKKELGRHTLALSIAGWYQFHSHTSDCYYSPTKTDATLGVLKWTAALPNHFRLVTKARSGYSFWEETPLYGLGLRIERQREPLLFDLGCDYANSSLLGQGSGYRSLECSFRMRKAL